MGVTLCLLTNLKFAINYEEGIIIRIGCLLTIKDFKVLYNHDMTSDHFPIETILSFDYSFTNFKITKYYQRDRQNIIKIISHKSWKLNDGFEIFKLSCISISFLSFAQYSITCRSFDLT
ncbi:hypothetical protein BpHYR1_050132 [Brachionus plicatilis]|uniref:RNA-directed DNA polymerase from mobile element jockey-like n=1 Tax=Brachionus plicatilis TaxID=10195 RepID=A0A3M7RKJ6_BRAPC|nr:hypothetical protein BpHYR1_050132 [Brachionus plicatilis]